MCGILLGLIFVFILGHEELRVGQDGVLWHGLQACFRQEVGSELLDELFNELFV